MAVRQPHYSQEESARRGNGIYERQIRPQVEAGNHGKVVAIDIDTGAFEVAEDTLVASDRAYLPANRTHRFDLCASATVACIALVCAA